MVVPMTIPTIGRWFNSKCQCAVFIFDMDLFLFKIEGDMFFFM